MKYFSTFSGIGGMELGIGPEHECVGFSEIDKFAVPLYQKHFPAHKNYGDITKIDAAALPDFELLVGGFPCQTFSIAGKRAGFSDTRGTLFFELARILHAKRPRLFLFENVKGLLSHDDGRTFRTIIAALDELGYDLQWQLLNSKNHGVPQNRERIFIVGHLRGSPRPEVFPLGENDGIPERAHGAKGRQSQAAISPTLKGASVKADNAFVLEEVGRTRSFKKDRGLRPAAGGNAPTLTGRNKGSDSDVPYILQRARGKNEGGDKSVAPTLTGKSYEHNNHVAFTLKARHDGGIDKKHPQTLVVETAGGGQLKVPEATKQGYAVAQEGDSINLAVMGSKTRRGRVGKGIAQTLDTGMQQHTLQGMRIRRLTPVECERLQGFPDGWTEGVSDTQRYKTLGNAVTVNVIRDIMGRLL